MNEYKKEDMIDKRYFCGNSVVIRIRQNILTSRIDGFKKVFDQEIMSGTVRLIVDFSLLDMIFSIHLGNFLFYQKRFQKLGGGLRICNASDQVKRILERSGMLVVVQCYDSDIEASSSF